VSVRVSDATARERVLDSVRRHPGESGAAICSRAALNRSRTIRVLRELVREGKLLQQSGADADRAYRLPPASRWESPNAGDNTRPLGRRPLPSMDAAIEEARTAGDTPLADRLSTLRDAWARAVERTGAVEDTEPPERLQAGGAR